jgi:integrase
MSPRSGAAIWLILATGCRVSEAMNARWEHVDMQRKKWHLPETKNERDHTIHLSAFALHHLNDLAAIRDSELIERRKKDRDAAAHPWLFPSSDGKTSVCPKSFGKQLADRQRAAERRMKNRSKRTESLILPGGRWTAHDLRRTAATRMAKLGVSGDVIDECLNHMIESRVRRVYVLDRREEQQAAAFDLLGAHLTALTQSDGTAQEATP